MSEPSLWPQPIRLGDIQRRAPRLDLEADAARRETIARALDLLALERFTAEVSAKPWLDGAEISARWSARIRQTCGLSLEAFETDLSGAFTVRAVPADSPAAVAEDAEVNLDPDAEDPPDVLEADQVDVGAYLVEHLALELDPFPRKPGTAFEPPPEEHPASPFAVLKSLKPPPDERP